MFGQMLPGSEPRPGEDLDWHYNSRFRQTSIFGDIQPWVLNLGWVEQCFGSQNWVDQTDTSQNWVDQTDSSQSWTNIEVPEINKTRC